MNLNDIILEKFLENKNIIILLFFWIEDCVPCKIMKNIIENIKNLFKKRIKIIKINANYNIYITEKFSIRNIPTIIIIYNKNIIIKKQGILEKNYIKKIIKKINNE